MGPTWVLSTPNGPHVGPMNLAIRVLLCRIQNYHFGSHYNETTVPCVPVFFNMIPTQTLIYYQGVTEIRPWKSNYIHQSFNTLRPRQNGLHFADDIFKRLFMHENVWILPKISLNFVCKVPINNIPALVQIMAWCRLFASLGLNEVRCNYSPIVHFNDSLIY